MKASVVALCVVAALCAIHAAKADRVDAILKDLDKLSVDAQMVLNNLEEYHSNLNNKLREKLSSTNVAVQFQKTIAEADAEFRAKVAEAAKKGSHIDHCRLEGLQHFAAPLETLTKAVEKCESEAMATLTPMLKRVQDYVESGRNMVRQIMSVAVDCGSTIHADVEYCMLEKVTSFHRGVRNVKAAAAALTKDGDETVERAHEQAKQCASSPFINALKSFSRGKATTLSCLKEYGSNPYYPYYPDH